MLASNILISGMYEFALMNRPVFLYIPDYEEYKDDRDFYIDLFSLPFPWAKDIGKLIYELKCFDNALPI
ncbi:hypothetical protein FACS1894163_05080 [Spirochaetia bacterium]|nr:hypothetical protein FACS1894163_05080 [Spirochaetia bacterium]